MKSDFFFFFLNFANLSVHLDTSLGILRHLGTSNGRQDRNLPMRPGVHTKSRCVCRQCSSQHNQDASSLRLLPRGPAVPRDSSSERPRHQGCCVLRAVSVLLGSMTECTRALKLPEDSSFCVRCGIWKPRRICGVSGGSGSPATRFAENTQNKRTALPQINK